MRPLRLLFALGLLAWASASAGVPEFPQHDFTAHFMRESFPPRMEKLAARMQASMAKNRDWTISYLKTAPAGQPLPYHPNLGLSESEYREFIEGATKAELKEVLECEVKVRTNDQGQLQLDTGKAVPILESLAFDPRSGAITTPHGELTQFKPVNQANGGAIGPWVGYNYFLEKGDVAHGTGKILSFTMGRRNADQKSFIYYKFKVAKDAQNLDAGELILFYEDKGH